MGENSGELRMAQQMRHFTIFKRFQRVRQNVPRQFTLMGKRLSAVHARIDWTTITNTAILFTRRRRRQWQPDNHSTITRSFTTVYVRRRFLQPNKKEKPSTSLSNYFLSLNFFMCLS